MAKFIDPEALKHIHDVLNEDHSGEKNAYTRNRHKRKTRVEGNNLIIQARRKDTDKLSIRANGGEEYTNPTVGVSGLGVNVAMPHCENVRELQDALCALSGETLLQIVTGGIDIYGIAKNILEQKVASLDGHNDNAEHLLSDIMDAGKEELFPETNSDFPVSYDSNDWEWPEQSTGIETVDNDKSQLGNNIF